LFTDLLPSCFNDHLKLLERYRIGRLFWRLLSTSDYQIFTQLF